MNCVGSGLLYGTGVISLSDWGRPQNTLFLSTRSITVPHCPPQNTCKDLTLPTLPLLAGHGINIHSVPHSKHTQTGLQKPVS